MVPCEVSNGRLGLGKVFGFEFGSGVGLELRLDKQVRRIHTYLIIHIQLRIDTLTHSHIHTQPLTCVMASTISCSMPQTGSCR